MVRLRLLLACAVGCAALTVAGCGSTTANVAGERTVAGVRATLEAFMTAVGAGDSRVACSMMRVAAQKQLLHADSDLPWPSGERRTCAQDITLISELVHGSPRAEPQLAAYSTTAVVTVRGNTATVTKTSKSDGGTLRYADGRWRFTDE